MRYHVKFQHQGRTFYAIFSKAAPDRPGFSIVEDATLPKSYIVEDNRLIDIPLPKNFGESEFDKFVETELENAGKVSDAFKGIAVGKLFNVPVADGCAFYLITKVNKKTVKIEWRGFQGDRWIDQRFGHGGTFDRSMIQPFVGQQDFWLEMEQNQKLGKS